MTTTFKPGASVTVHWVRPEGDVQEQAVIARTTSDMLPLPAGYVPVRFVGDTGTVLVYCDRICPI